MCRKNAAEKREKKSIYFSERKNDEERRKGTAREKPLQKVRIFYPHFWGFVFAILCKTNNTKKGSSVVFPQFHNDENDGKWSVQPESESERERESARGCFYKKYYLTWLKTKIIGSEAAASRWPTINVDKYRISFAKLPSSTSSIIALICSNLRQNFHKIMLLIYHTWE